MGDYREQIEGQFAALKAATKAGEDALATVLPPALQAWVLTVTAAVVADVHAGIPSPARGLPRARLRNMLLVENLARDVAANLLVCIGCPVNVAASAHAPGGYHAVRPHWHAA